MKEKPSLFKVFLYFLKIGLITFGGGYAIIATLEKELVDEKQWISHDDMLNMVVIGESTPGPIAINLATFIGYKMYGFWGSFLCTLGFILPSFAIIVLVSVAIDYITNVPDVVKWLFKGVRAGVVILIGNAAVKFFKKMDKKIITFLLFLTAFFVGFFTNFNVIYLMLIGGSVGLIYTLLVSYSKKKEYAKNQTKCKFTGRIEGKCHNNEELQADIQLNSKAQNIQICDENDSNVEPIKSDNINKNDDQNDTNFSEENCQNVNENVDKNNEIIMDKTSAENADNIIENLHISSKNNVDNLEDANNNNGVICKNGHNEGGNKWYI